MFSNTSETSFVGIGQADICRSEELGALPQHHDNIPAESDVLCGQDKTYAKHPGNQIFREVIESWIDVYTSTASKQSKMKMTKEIVRYMQTKHNSRFIKKVAGRAGEWEEISEKHARDKISHALRFAAKQRKEDGSSNNNNNISDDGNDVGSKAAQAQKKRRGHRRINSCGSTASAATSIESAVDTSVVACGGHHRRSVSSSSYFLTHPAIFGATTMSSIAESSAFTIVDNNNNDSHSKHHCRSDSNSSYDTQTSTASFTYSNDNSNFDDDFEPIDIFHCKQNEMFDLSHCEEATIEGIAALRFDDDDETSAIKTFDSSRVLQQQQQHQQQYNEFGEACDTLRIEDPKAIFGW